MSFNPNYRIRSAELNTVDLTNLAQNIYMLLYSGIQQQINNSISVGDAFEIVSSDTSQSDSLFNTSSTSSTSLNSLNSSINNPLQFFIPTGSTLISPYGTTVVISST